MKTLLLATTLLAASAQHRAPALDCQKASTAVDKLICANQDVVELDTGLAQAYVGLLGVIGADAAAALKAEQRAWLANERAKCADAACLKGAYTKRLAAVNKRVAAAFMAPAGAEATYSFEKAPLINPAIVEDLEGAISDRGDQVLAVDVQGSQRSNRYFAEPFVDRTAEPTPRVSYRKESRSSAIGTSARRRRA